jgi:hypothetical protein
MLQPTTQWPHNVTRRTSATEFERLIQIEADRLAAGRTTRVVREPGK